MKAVLISIKPKWCELIAQGKKTVEVRKTKPKLETPFKVYIYATKPRHYFKISEHLAATDENLFLSNGTVKMSDGFEHWADGIKVEYLNGKVIGEFVCNRIDYIGWTSNPTRLDWKNSYNFELQLHFYRKILQFSENDVQYNPHWDSTAHSHRFG